MNPWELYLKNLHKQIVNEEREEKKRAKRVFGSWNNNHKYSKIKQ
jgi:hypothetical protein